MSRTGTSRRRFRSQAAVGVALFPFLAVLISAMGVLILMLVVMGRNARVAAVQAARQRAVASPAMQRKLAEAREDLEWQQSELIKSRQATEAQLAEARLKLGHVEDHARRLRQEIARLEAAWRQIESAQAGDAQQCRALEAELARLRQEAAEAQAQIGRARQAAERPRSYAVIPYDGPNGTHRRPIYLECRADAVVLQPEGIVFPAEDFDGPSGPGNPLDSALRAVREQWLAQGQLDPEKAGEPYPLLLVRPGGIAAYYAARASMQSWGSEFGYELIGEEWRMEFPAPDAVVAQAVNKAVDSARVRQQLLARAAPRQYGGQDRPRYRPAPYRGGVVRDGGGSEVTPSGYQSATPGDRYAGGQGSPGSQGSQGGQGLEGGQNSQGGQTAGPRGQRSLPEGLIAGRPQRETDGPASNGTGGMIRRPGEWFPDQPEAKTQPPGESPSDDKPRRLADARGRNWGLPDAANGSVAVTRPIRVECYRDRLVLVPEQGLGGGRTVPLGPRTEDSVDGFISAVWEHMGAWGIAGRGMYWRPVLSVRVAPDAQDRFHDLDVLLEGSGLDVTRKEG